MPDYKVSIKSLFIKSINVFAIFPQTESEPLTFFFIKNTYLTLGSLKISPAGIVPSVGKWLRWYTGIPLSYPCWLYG